MNTPHPPTIMMLTMTMTGTTLKAAITPLTAKHTWIPSTGEDGTPTREEGTEEGAGKEAHPAQTDPEGRVAVDEHWTAALNIRGTTAKGVAPGTAAARRTSMSKEDEEEERGIGAGTISMTTLHPQNPPESLSPWRNLSMSCW